MPSEKLETFGGIIPRVTNQRRLPKTSATRAQDVDLTSGALVPIGVEAPMQTLHDTNGDIKGDVDVNTIASITKPAAVTKAAEIYMCVPNTWLKIEMDCWVSYVDNLDVYSEDHIADMAFRGPNRVKYTEDGFIAYFTMSEIKFSPLARDGKYYNYLVNGPKFRFQVDADTNYLGGPEVKTEYPENVLVSSDGEVPIFSHPLTYPINMSGFDSLSGVGIDRFTYGFLELVDFTIPYVEQEVTVTAAVTDYILAPQGEVSFRFRCNYVRNTQQFTMYRQTLVDTALDREGPPSDESAVFVTDPGKILRLQLVKNGTYTQTNLYRSGGGGDDSYGLLTEDAGGFTGDTDFDPFTGTTSDVLEPYGNYPHTTAALAAENSIIHPADWSCIFYQNQALPSAIGKYWAYPEEYIIEFPTYVNAATLVGNTIVVFTVASATEEGKVYAMSGNDPKYLSIYKLSDGDPLLTKASLARIRGRVFWSSYDGLMSTDGSSVVNITEPFYTREEWLEAEPEYMSAYTSENTVWMVTAGAVNLRIDMDEKEKEPFAFLTTFTGFSGKDFIWESKIFEYPSPMAFSHVRVLAEAYPIGVGLFDKDGVERAVYMVLDDRVARLPRMRTEREWKFRVHGNATTYFVGFSTNAKELQGNGA